MAQIIKNMPAMQETWVQSLGWEDPLEKGKVTLSQYSGLENSMDSIVHGVAKSRTLLSNFHFHFQSLFTFPYPWWMIFRMIFSKFGKELISDMYLYNVLIRWQSFLSQTILRLFRAPHIIIGNLWNCDVNNPSSAICQLYHLG